MSADALQSAGRHGPEAAGAHVAALFEQHGRIVYGLCRIILGDPGDAEDAAQQTFLSAYRSLLAGREPHDPAAWLAAIARNESRSRIRARRRRPPTVVGESEASSDDAASVSGQRELVAALYAAVAELPQAQREAIVLREFYGLSHREVALVLGISVAAVDGLLGRARKRLQVDLEPVRVASGVLFLPAALSEGLRHAIPGFAGPVGGSLAAKIAALPVGAKVAVALVALAAGGTAVSEVADRGGPVRSPVARAAVLSPRPLPDQLAGDELLEPVTKHASRSSGLVKSRLPSSEDEEVEEAAVAAARSRGDLEEDGDAAAESREAEENGEDVSAGPEVETEADEDGEDLDGAAEDAASPGESESD